MDLSEIFLEEIQEQDADQAVGLISIVMNQDEGKWARNTLVFHFGCMKNQLKDGRSYFVWKRGEKIFGMVGLHHYIWGPEENVWLAWLAVHPAYQRKGIGKRLLHSIEKIASRMGFAKLLVETYGSSDFDKARAFYASNGFTKLGGIADYLSNGAEMVVYGKKIG